MERGPNSIEGGVRWENETIKLIKHYQFFTSIHEMDHYVVALHISSNHLNHQYEAMKVLQSLLLIIRVVGVSFAKYDTITTGVGSSENRHSGGEGVRILFFY